MIPVSILETTNHRGGEQICDCRGVAGGEGGARVCKRIARERPRDGTLPCLDYRQGFKYLHGMPLHRATHSHTKACK